MGYQRALVTAKWDDRQTNIQLYMSATGWRDSTFLNGNVIYQWSAKSAQSLDPMRQLLRKKFGDRNQTTRQWIPLPEFVLIPLGGGTASGGDGELYQAPISELTFVYALLPLIWLAWQVFRKWRRRRADPAAIECNACGYDMRATPDRCPECGKVRENLATKAQSRRVSAGQIS